MYWGTKVEPVSILPFWKSVPCPTLFNFNKPTVMKLFSGAILRASYSLPSAHYARQRKARRRRVYRNFSRQRRCADL